MINLSFDKVYKKTSSQKGQSSINMYKMTFLLSMYQKYVAKSHIHDEKDDMDIIFGFLSFF